MLYVLFQGTIMQPRADDRPFFLWLNEVRDFIRDNRNNPIFAVLFGVPRVVIDTLITTLTSTLEGDRLAGAGDRRGRARSGGRRHAARRRGRPRAPRHRRARSVELGGRDAGAVSAAVAISFLIGVPIGILVARNDRARALITPILDVMQIMPTFAYLAPFVLFFGIGPAAAAIVTLIYAMPAAIRITAFGIRSVPANTVEAGRSLGRDRSPAAVRRCSSPSRDPRSRWL